MAGPYSPTDLRSYEAALNVFDKKVKGAIAKVIKKTVTECYREIVATSPHETGSYIASHRIGINAVDGSDTVYTKKNPMAEGTAKAQALTELQKLNGLKDTDTVYISNSVGFSNPNHYSWAANVEYSGWNNKGGYLIYEKAALMAINRIPQYVQYVKGQGDKILDTILD
jgi:hypothetical protein